MATTQASRPNFILPTAATFPATTPFNMPVQAKPVLPQAPGVLPTPVSVPAVAPSLVAGVAAQATAPAKVRRVRTKAHPAAGLTKAKTNLTYIKVAEGATGTIKLGSAKTIFGKNPDYIFHGLARAVGTLADVNKFINDPEFLKKAPVEGINIPELGNPSWIVTSGNYEQLKTTAGSWVASELALTQKKSVKSEAETAELPKTDLKEDMESYYSALKSTRSKTLTKNDPINGFQAKLIAAQEKRSALDVSNFDSVKKTGYKTIPYNPEKPKRQLPILSSIPVCSNNRQTLEAFLQVLGKNPEEVQALLGEWVEPVAV